MINVFTYSVRIRAFEKGSQPKWAVVVFKAMQQQGVMPNGVTCKSLICTCAMGSHPEWALELFQVM